VGVRRIRSKGAELLVKQLVDWLMAGNLLGAVMCVGSPCLWQGVPRQYQNLAKHR
jgi:hypothetical protein